MKLYSFGILVKDILNEFIWIKVKSFDKILFVFVFAFGLNIVSTIFSLKSIEVLRSLLMTQENVDFKDTAYRYVVNTAIILVTKYLSEILASFYIEKISRTNMTLFLRRRMEMKYEDIIKSDSGETVSIIQTKLNAYKSIFEIMMFKSISMIIFIVSSMFKLDTGSHFIIHVLSIAYPIVYIVVSFTRLLPIIDTYRKLISKKKLISSLLYDKIQNFEVVKFFGIERQQANDVFNKTDVVRNLMFHMKLQSTKRSCSIQILSEAPLFTLCILNAVNSNLNIQNIGLTYMIFKNLNTMLRDISTLIYDLGLALNSLEESDIAVNNQKKRVDLSFNNNIRFRSVNILHDDKQIISNIDIDIEKYDKVAIVGNNGAGKSSFVRSMLNFSNYTGEILVDSQNIKKCLPSDLFKLFSYVSQDDYISKGTVLDNIVIGKRNVTMEEIEKVSKKIGLHDEILQMKDGYKTDVGTGGNDISPSQKKKISLLRAFAKNSPILVLDEATSTLDKKYEEFFVKEILSKIQDKTIFVIIHNKDLVKYFDKVIFLKDGQVNDYGLYKDVSKRNQYFKRFIEENMIRASN